MQEWTHAFLTSTLNGSEWTASSPSWFTPGTCIIQSCMVPTATVGTIEKRKLFALLRMKPQFLSQLSYGLAIVLGYTSFLMNLLPPRYPLWQRPNILLKCWCSNIRLYLTSQNTTSSWSPTSRLKISPTSTIRHAVTSHPGVWNITQTISPSIYKIPNCSVKSQGIFNYIACHE